MIYTIQELADAIENEVPEGNEDNDILAFLSIPGHSAHFRILGVEWDPDAGDSGALVLNVDTVSV